MEREFTYQANAIQFLSDKYGSPRIFLDFFFVDINRSNFDFNLLFKHGIPYLNHQEEGEVREREQRAARGMLEDIHVEDGQKDFVILAGANRDSDQTNLCLQLQEVVDQLQKWVDDPNPELDFVNITGPGDEINGYQKRLVHQVVRSKFPGLVTVSSASGISNSMPF